MYEILPYHSNKTEQACCVTWHVCGLQMPPFETGVLSVKKSEVLCTKHIEAIWKLKTYISFHLRKQVRQVVHVDDQGHKNGEYKGSQGNMVYTWPWTGIWLYSWSTCWLLLSSPSMTVIWTPTHWVVRQVLFWVTIPPQLCQDSQLPPQTNNHTPPSMSHQPQALSPPLPCPSAQYPMQQKKGQDNVTKLLFRLLLRLQTIKAIVDSCSFKSLKSDEPRRVQVLDLYCLTRFESESSSKGIVY